MSTKQQFLYICWIFFDYDKVAKMAVNTGLVLSNAEKFIIYPLPQKSAIQLTFQQYYNYDVFLPKLKRAKAFLLSPLHTHGMLPPISS